MHHVVSTVVQVKETIIQCVVSVDNPGLSVEEIQGTIDGANTHTLEAIDG